MNVGVRLLFSQCKTFIVDKKKFSHFHVISILANDAVAKYKVEKFFKRK